MNKRREKRLRDVTIWVSFGLVLTASVLSAESQSTGLSFLKIAVGARSLGLGSAYTAIANDATALYWNPAGLSSLRKKELSLMHSEWLLGSRFDFLGIGYPLRVGTLGFGVSLLSQPLQEGRDAQGRKTEDFGSRNSAYTLALSRRVTTKTKAGFSLKLIQSQIATYRGQGLSFDLGINHHLITAPLSFGLALQNTSSGIRFLEERTKLPLTIAGGIGYHALDAFVVATDIKYRVYDHKTILAFGAEYSLVPSFALRTGYSLREKRNLSNLSGLGAGFGLKILNYRLDYALTPLGELGNTHRISLAMRF